MEGCSLFQESFCYCNSRGSLLRTKNRTVHTAPKITVIWTNNVIHCSHAPKIIVIWINKVILFFTICRIIPYLVTGHVIELGKKVSQKMNTESCNEELLGVTKSSFLLLWNNEVFSHVEISKITLCLLFDESRPILIIKHVLSLMGSISECNLWGRLIEIL